MTPGFQERFAIPSIPEWIDHLPAGERILTDVLRGLVLETLPACREKLSRNVPHYYGHRRICLIWPASVPGGGIRSGVLLGFCQGPALRDPAHYLMHGSNKRVFYRIFKETGEIDPLPVITLLREAARADRGYRADRRRG